jgi:penicillin V acylase-like amidase (Ntn superfamily)
MLSVRLRNLFTMLLLLLPRHSVDDLERDLRSQALTPVGPSVAGGQHFVVRDSSGSSLVVEFLLGQVVLYRDHNDNGTTGFGVMTNEPAFAWQASGWVAFWVVGVAVGVWWVTLGRQ